MSAFFDPAEIERKIDERLAGTGAAVKRASLLTLVVVHPESLAGDVAARLDYLFGKRPLRIIRIETGHRAPTAVDVSARCLPHPAGDEVCFQEIVFYNGPDNWGLDGALWSLLVIRDLPVVLAWLGEPAGLAALLDRSAFAADKCVFDSGLAGGRDAARDPRSRLVRTLAFLARRFAPGAGGPAAPALSDFAWRALTPLRVRIARLFDAPDALPLLARLERIELSGLPVVSAALIALWLAARLGWSRPAGTGEGLAFAGPAGRPVTVRLPAAGGERFSASFAAATGERLGLGRAAGEDETYEPVCGEECLLAEIDHLAPDPAYVEILDLAARCADGGFFA